MKYKDTKGGCSMRRNLFLRVIPMLLILLLCSGCFCASAEEGLPAYTGKLTVEDSFDEETVNWFLDRLAEEKFYTYDPALPVGCLLRQFARGKKADVPRPSHADWPAMVKYGEAYDIRGGGPFSGKIGRAHV